VREPPAERDVPVLLVHGIDDDHRTLANLREHLLAAGFADVEAVDLRPNDGSGGLPPLAHQVRDAADRLRARTGATRVDVVAFSMGALVTRYWLMRLDGKPAVRRFVSISGPHHGTLTAYLGRNEGVQQMRPGSPLLADLARDEGDWAPVEVVSFWTPLDLMIFPPSSSVLAGATQRTFPVPAHPLMLHDRRVLEAVVEALRARRPEDVPAAVAYPRWP
jgi:triacylglycerol esterase/lipase EstA (alpha/beta hydrolase family)